MNQLARWLLISVLWMATPIPALAQSRPAFAGTWVVVGDVSAQDLRSPALGSTVTIAMDAAFITISYSMGREWKLALDGSEIRRVVRVADAGSYVEVAKASWSGDAIVIDTGRDRGGRVAREQRVLSIVNNRLAVSAKSWVDGSVVRESRLDYLAK